MTGFAADVCKALSAIDEFGLSIIARMTFALITCRIPDPERKVVIFDA